MMTKDNFLRWVNTARPGNSCVYYQGFLARDCSTVLSPKTRYAQDTLRSLRMLVQATAAAGLVALVQRRLDATDYQYLAQRTAMPRPRHLEETARAIRAAMMMVPGINVPAPGQ
jgi:hypothetical protein